MPEPNKLNWRGIRPTHPVENIFTSVGKFDLSLGSITRNQISKSATSTGDLVVVHTVSDGKTLHLIHSNFGYVFATQKTSQLYYRDTSDANNIYLYNLNGRNLSFGIATSNYAIPIIIPSGYDICLFTDSEFVSCYILGWEQ